MTEKFIRTYKKFDLDDVKKHLLIHGDLSSSCSNCGEMNLSLDKVKCPKCETEFKYIAFRNIKHHIPKLLKLSEERPQFQFIDYDDYKQQSGASKAQDFFK